MDISSALSTIRTQAQYADTRTRYFITNLLANLVCRPSPFIGSRPSEKFGTAQGVRTVLEVFSIEILFII